MQRKFLRHSTELGNLAHCLYKSTLEIGKVGFNSRQKKPTTTSNKLVNKVMGVKSANARYSIQHVDHEQQNAENV